MLFHATLSLAMDGDESPFNVPTTLFRAGGGGTQYPLAEWASELVWTFWWQDKVLTLPGIEHRLHLTFFVLTEYDEI